MNDPEPYSGDMEWFSGRPNIVEIRKDGALLQQWPCPRNCGGEMVATGEAWMTTIPGYFHKCTKCGRLAALSGHKFPRFVYSSSSSSS